MRSRIGFVDRNTPGEPIEADKRAMAAVELRLMGASFQEIADEIGFASKGAAHDAYTRGYVALTHEIRADAAEAVQHQLARNKSYRRRALIAGNEQGAQIAAIATALQIDKFDAQLRGMQSGAAANLDAVPALLGPDGGSAVCAKCRASAAPTDLKFELERIEKIKAVLIESGALLLPFKPVEDDLDWENEQPQTSPPQTAVVAQSETGN